jgi:hypothetical protein
MTLISQAQWDQMGQDSFDARMIAILRRHHPEQAASVPFADLVAMIHRQLAHARGYGLHDERSAATYVHAAWLLGEEFDRRIPAIAQILRERRMTCLEKSAAIGHFCLLVFRTLEKPAAPQKKAA